ncbi:hypothetical protein PR048_014295 [Dryococelus australis]|uniref:Uncharacterized protein n=1 Tax=Dryococelus australis TaxID=614101 RepID=A0ABQ9HDZ6_9NEOP|nr:hypothetical protein PR048_014295 [Dryococelus australis]
MVGCEQANRSATVAHVDKSHRTARIATVACLTHFNNSILANAQVKSPLIRQTPAAHASRMQECRSPIRARTLNLRGPGNPDLRACAMEESESRRFTGAEGFPEAVVLIWIEGSLADTFGNKLDFTILRCSLADAPVSSQTRKNGRRGSGATPALTSQSRRANVLGAGACPPASAPAPSLDVAAISRADPIFSRVYVSSMSRSLETEQMACNQEYIPPFAWSDFREAWKRLKLGWRDRESSQMLPTRQRTNGSGSYTQRIIKIFVLSGELARFPGFLPRRFQGENVSKQLLVFSRPEYSTREGKALELLSVWQFSPSTRVPAESRTSSLFRQGVAVPERLACSPSTKVNRVQSPAGSPDDAAGRRIFLGISRSPALAFRRCSILASLHPHRILRPRC